MFTTDIRLAISRNDSLIAAFLDITAAYDNVKITILKSKLEQLKVPTRLTNFIYNMLSERFLHYDIVHLGQNETIDRTVWKGLPEARY